MTNYDESSDICDNESTNVKIQWSNNELHSIFGNLYRIMDIRIFPLIKLQ